MRCLVIAATLLGCRGGSSPVVQIAVEASYPGGSAETTAASVTTPLERRLLQLAHVASMHSRTTRGAVTIIVAFDHTTFDDAALAVQGAIAGSARDMPAEMPAPPSFHKLGPRLARYAMSGPFTAIAISEQAKLAADKLAQIEGVFGVEMCGHREHEIHVDLVADKLAATDVTAAEIVGAIPAHATIEQLRDVVVSTRHGAPIRLGDVALVSDAASTPACEAFTDHPVVEIIVSGAADAADRVTAAIAEFRRQLPASMVIDPIPAMHVFEISAYEPARIRPLVDKALGSQAHQLVEVRDHMLRVEVDGEAQVLERARARLAEIPNVVVVEPDATLELVGPDRDQLLAVADKLTLPKAIRIGTDTDAVLAFAIDRDRAAALGVPVADIARTTELVSETRGRGSPVVRFLDMREQILDALFVHTTTGARVPLLTVVTATRTLDGEILHASQYPMVGFRVRAAELPALEALQLPPGVHAQVVPD